MRSSVIQWKAHPREALPNTLTSSWLYIRMKDSCVPFLTFSSWLHCVVKEIGCAKGQGASRHSAGPEIWAARRAGLGQGHSMSLPAAWDVCRPWWNRWGVKYMKCLYGATATIPVRPDWSWKEKPNAENLSGLPKVSAASAMQRELPPSLRRSSLSPAPLNFPLCPARPLLV